MKVNTNTNRNTRRRGLSQSSAAERSAGEKEEARAVRSTRAETADHSTRAKTADCSTRAEAADHSTRAKTAVRSTRAEAAVPSTRAETAVRRNPQTSAAAGDAGSPDPDTENRAETLRQAERRRRRAMQREKRARALRRQRVLAISAVVVLIALFAGGRLMMQKTWANSALSEKVISYHDTVKKYAEREGIEKYTDTLMAIMMAETKGEGKDVMQSSESKGLERNSLEPEESIEQACIYFAALIDIAHNLEIKDDKALIQSYNFGPGYLTYIAKHGKKHKESLAIEYAKEHSGGEKVRYMHLYAIKQNGGWIYKFGNMFYEAIVEEYM